MPLLKSGVKTLGKEALHGGLGVLSDIASNNAPVRQSIRNRAHESLENLKRKAGTKIDSLMEGSGYKKRKIFGLSSQLTDPLSAQDVPVPKRKRRRAGGKKKARKGQKRKRKSSGRRKKKIKNRKARVKRSRKRSKKDIFA